MHNFKELKIWKESRLLVKHVYNATSMFPDSEKFALTSQIKRSVVSIVSNIAEGAGRGSDKDFLKFLNISLGSAYELETQIILAYDLGFIKKEKVSDLGLKIQEIQKMITGFINKLQTENNLNNKT